MTVYLDAPRIAVILTLFCWSVLSLLIVYQQSRIISAQNKILDKTLGFLRELKEQKDNTNSSLEEALAGVDKLLAKIKS